MDAALQSAITAAAAAAPDPQELPATVPGRIVHIDGDYLAYQASGKEGTTQGEARTSLLERIDRFRRWAGAEHAVVHLTARTSHKGERFLIATVKPYQGTRSGHHPTNWEFLRQFMEESAFHTMQTVNYQLWFDREADDAVAAAGGVTCMKDKDSRMNNTLHINWDRPYLMIDNREDHYELIGEDGLIYGRKWFFLQMLMGDPVDSIPGLEKYATYTAKGAPTQKLCGEATATEILRGTTNVDEALRAVSEAYKGYYEDSWAERFAEQAMLLWMRRDEKADLLDFLRYLPEWNSCYLPIADAAIAIKQRVEAERAQIENYGG